MNTNQLLRECSDYFHSKPGFHRALFEMRRKWESLERVSGTVKLQHLNDAERQALSGFFSRRIDGNIVSFQMQAFEEALQKTKYAGIHLEDLLAEYFAEPLLSKRQLSQKKQDAREQLFQDLLDNAAVYQQPLLTDWIHSLKNSPHSLQSFHSAEDTKTAVLSCINALNKILNLEPASSIPLSVLAMESCRNPHGFDAGTSVGRLFLRALSFYQNRETTPASAEEKLELYIDCQIRPDDISSFTVIQGIRFYTDKGPHPAYDGFIKQQEYFLMNLSQLKSIVSARPVTDPVFIIENQMVYSELCRNYPDHSLICTSGQLKTASLLVIDLLCQTDATIYYCGDIDPEGLSIAQKLITRSHDRILPWHMSPKDYHDSLSDIAVSDSRLLELKHLSNPELIRTARELKNIKKAGYQEKLISFLIQDIRNLPDN